MVEVRSLGHLVVTEEDEVEVDCRIVVVVQGIPAEDIAVEGIVAVVAVETDFLAGCCVHC